MLGIFANRYYHRAIKTLRNLRVSKDLRKKLPLVPFENNQADRTYKDTILAYWKNYRRIWLNWHSYYASCNGIRDARYIPEDIFHNYIEPYYNKLEFAVAYADKSMYNVFFPALNHPIVIVKNINGQYYDDNFVPLTKEEAIAGCLGEDACIIKPILDSGGGRNIDIFHKGKLDNYECAIRDAMDQRKKDYVIQKLILQHEDISEIYRNSINTIRIISFLHKGIVHILSAVLRVGANGAYVDNITAGGMSVGIYPDGRLKSIAYDKYGHKCDTHPQGFVFSNGTIPSYQRILDIIRHEHLRFGYFKLISWDFAVDSQSRPVFVEYNLIWQGINLHQMNNGPLFGDMTDEVLREVFPHK